MGLQTYLFQQATIDALYTQPSRRQHLKIRIKVRRMRKDLCGITSQQCSLSFHNTSRLDVFGRRGAFEKDVNNSFGIKLCNPRHKSVEKSHITTTACKASRTRHELKVQSDWNHIVLTENAVELHAITKYKECDNWQCDYRVAVTWNMVKPPDLFLSCPGLFDWGRLWTIWAGK